MTKNRTEKEILEEISMKLDKMIGVLAIAGKEPKKQIHILARLGFSIQDSMALTGLTENIVKKERVKVKK